MWRDGELLSAATIHASAEELRTAAVLRVLVEDGVEEMIFGVRKYVVVRFADA